MKCILCAALLLLSANFLQAQNKQEDWANFARFDSANQIIKKLPQNERKAVFMGNSITQGWIDHDPSYFSSNNYINRGISGQTSSQMLIRFRKDVIELHPKTVVILAGTNDIAGNTGYISPDNILGNIISMCELANIHHIKPILCSLLPAFDYPWSRGKHPDIEIPKLNAMIKNYAAKNNIAYVDYFSAMTNGKNGLPENISEDGVHPNLEGNKIMEKTLKAFIEKALR